MPATVVLGAQWGDEGKGKAIDQLAADSSWAVRFQGGNNAGHTVVYGDTTLKLHQIPSGVSSLHCSMILGDGMVIDPWVLEQELDRWFDISGERPEGKRLFISERASIILPFHRLYDSADKIVGTTGRGIGPAYRDRIERVGIRFADIINIVEDNEELSTIVERMNTQLESVKVESKIELKSLQSDLRWILSRYGECIKPTGLMIDFALKNNENVLLEGAQGAMLDIDQGTYPFVTSSVTCRANATHGAGIHPGHVEQCFGITKAYTTRVGNGPFPSELSLEGGPGMHMAKVGHEFGTTTGRPRRTGWLDLVALKESNRLNGYTGLVLTKLDVLGGLDEIKICVKYEVNGKEIDYLPAAVDDQLKVKPIYKTFPGWKSKTQGIRNFKDLPDKAKKYIHALEDFIGARISSISTSPEREDTILVEDPFKA